MKNMNDLLRQAQVMQNKIARLQQEMADKDVEASAGGGMVKVVMNGKQEMKSITIDKAVVEFLRVNTWIMKWFDVDYSKHTLKEGGYRHLPLEEKIRLLNKIHIPCVTVCEDVTEHYEYWKENYNPNRNDCCNLRL